MDSPVVALQEINFCPPGALIGALGDILGAPECPRYKVSHQVCEGQLEGALDVLIGCLGGGHTDGFPPRPKLCNSFKAHTIVIHLFHKEHLADGVPHPPMLKGSSSRCFYCELRRDASAGKAKKK